MYLFGENLKEQCRKQNVSQQQLADRMQVTYAAINQWINGKRKPKGSTACNIAEKLGVPVTDLLGCFPCHSELENAFKSIMNDLDEQQERLYEADSVPEEAGGIDYSDKVGILEKWESFFESTFESIVAFVISNPYPFSIETSCFEDAGSADCAEGAEYPPDKLDSISQDLLSSLKAANLPSAQYELLAALSPHLFPALYKTMAYAVQRENEKKSDGEASLLALYGRLNSKGRKAAEERLAELVQIQLYTEPVVSDNE